MVSQDFLFGNKHLRDFGFVMAQPSDDDGSGLNREILKGATNIYRNQAIHYGAVYSGVITLQMFIVKFNCDYYDEEISIFELRKLQSWLTFSKLPQPLYIVTKKGVMIEYRGIFTDISPYSYGGLNGVNLKFTCDSPFAYDTKKIKVQSENAKNGITKRIFCDTDELGDFIYPYIWYIPNAAGKISFKNQNDNNSIMSLALPKKYNEVVIDCRLKRIIADGDPLPLSDVNFSMGQITDYNNANTGIYRMYWLRLIPGKNCVDITGDGDFTITYKNLLKLGGLTNV